MDRRNFLVSLVVGGMSLATARKAFGQIAQRALAITIDHNHGHELVILDPDFNDGQNHQYDIRGKASHSHVVEITKEQFAMILQGQPVQTVSSTTFGHEHGIDIRVHG